MTKLDTCFVFLLHNEDQVLLSVLPSKQILQTARKTNITCILPFYGLYHNNDPAEKIPMRR